jgi:two-component system nitrate/nitrite response regulator NarL
VIDSTLTRRFIGESRALDRPPKTPLSRREVEILQRVTYGSATKEVADSLGISPQTVKAQLERIFEKLGANDRAQAVAIAIRQGLVE